MGNRYAIFTAVVGHYDEIKQPKVVDDHFDYILFSNDMKEKSIGVWQIMPIPYFNPIQTKIARWVKTHPEELLPQYNYSLWVDANIQIVSEAFYHRLFELMAEKVLISTVAHPKFNCVYQEMLVMIYARYEKESVVIDWGRFLRKEKYPRNNGLVETGLLFRQHSAETVKCFDKLWWKCIDEYSKRDQLSVNYSLWKQKMSYEPFFDRGITVRDSPMVAYKEVHANESKKWAQWGKWEAWLGRSVIHEPRRQSEIVDLYYRIYGMRFPHFWAVFYGQIYRIRDVLYRRHRIV